MKRQDGSIRSSNEPAYSKMSKNRIDRDFALYRCMVTKVNFVDNMADNVTATSQNKQVTYEAIIIGGAKEGQILQNVRDMNLYGGEFNFSEKIYRPINVKNIEEQPLSKHVGDIVYVAFIQGYTRAPVIIGAGDQPNDKTFTGATSEDGLIDRKQYNGVYEVVDKNGNWLLVRNGGDYDPDSVTFTPVANGNQASLQLIEQKVIASTGDNVSQVIDGATEKMTFTFKSGMTVTLDGKNDDVKILTKAMGEIHINGDKIAIGNGSGELFDQFSQALQKLITFFNSVDSAHTHLGNLGYPTGAPVQAAQFTQLGTDLSSIKSIVDQIKGTL